jgi:hypothetical protein
MSQIHPRAEMLVFEELLFDSSVVDGLYIAE